MGRAAALALTGALVIVFGLFLGFGKVGNGCGSAFSPDYSQSQLNDTFPGLAGYEDGCRDAVSSRRPFAYGALGLGGLAVVLSFVVPSEDRQRAS